MRHKKAVQNKFVTKKMRRFFDGLDKAERAEPAVVATRYGKSLLESWRASSLINQKKISKSKFYVGLSADGNFEDITKRAALVSDTLLLSHGHETPYRDIGIWRDGEAHARNAQDALMHVNGGGLWDPRENATNMYVGMHCPDLTSLGQWILDCEPLLTSGLAWYLPAYSTKEEPIEGSTAPPTIRPQPAGAIDFLIRDGRAIDMQSTRPIKSQVVRPVMEIDLPFLEGIDLHMFSRITVEEFDSYAGFRDFLRSIFLSMDDALNAVQSERELTRISLDIADQVRNMRTDIGRVSKSRAVAVTGAVAGSVTAVLTAVYGPALASVVAAVGAAGGWLPALEALAENSKKPLREDKWYYVWVLSRHGTNF